MPETKMEAAWASVAKATSGDRSSGPDLLLHAMAVAMCELTDTVMKDLLKEIKGISKDIKDIADEVQKIRKQGQ